MIYFDFFSSIDSIIHSAKHRTLVRYMYLKMGSKEAFHLYDIFIPDFVSNIIVFWSNFSKSTWTWKSKHWVSTDWQYLKITIPHMDESITNHFFPS